MQLFESVQSVHEFPHLPHAGVAVPGWHVLLLTQPVQHEPMRQLPTSPADRHAVDAVVGTWVHAPDEQPSIVQMLASSQFLDTVPLHVPPGSQLPASQQLSDGAQAALVFTGKLHAPPAPQTPARWHWSGAAPQFFGVPRQMPALSHLSVSVQGLPSLQLAFVVTANVQVVPVQTPAAWHWSGGAPHVFPPQVAVSWQSTLPSQLLSMPSLQSSTTPTAH